MLFCENRMTPMGVILQKIFWSGGYLKEGLIPWWGINEGLKVFPV